MNEAKKNRPGWYVLQVQTGTEDQMCDFVIRLCNEHDSAANSEEHAVGLQECFSPRFQTQKKWKGEWRDIERPLLPGYVIAVAERPEQLVKVLHGSRHMCRLLTDGETYIPLNEAERMWIEHQTAAGNRVVAMSFGHKVGDRLEITQGPLKGYEGEIVKIDRSNSLAELEFHVGQITVKTTVGLGIVPKR